MAFEAFRRVGRGFAKSRRATAAIEFAMILPLLVALIGGIVELGRILEVYSATNRLASQYAMSWAYCSESENGTGNGNHGKCSDELSIYLDSGAVQNVAPQLDYTNLQLRMFEVDLTGTASVGPVIVYPINTLASVLSSDELSSAQAAFPGQVGVVVTVQYNHTLKFFSSLAQLSSLSSKLQPTYTVAQRKT